MQNFEDKQLYRIAKRRAEFKKALIAYILVNSFLWCIYLLTDRHSRFPWPLWVMLGWGIGMAFKYVEAYHGNNWFSPEKEYDKLKNSGK
ncbi:MAG: 2TM domain-containing protein [Bacteroidota bacterium]